MSQAVQGVVQTLEWVPPDCLVQEELTPLQVGLCVCGLACIVERQQMISVSMHTMHWIGF